MRKKTLKTLKKLYVKWSSKDVEYLKKLYTRWDVPIEEIAKALNRSVHAIHCKAYTLGLRRPTPSLANEDYIKKLLNLNLEEA